MSTMLSSSKNLKIVALSDTHNQHHNLVIPPCDLLIHAGDWTYQGDMESCVDFAQWLDKQPAKHIVIVPGNHEDKFESNYPHSRDWISIYCPRANLLIHDSIEIEGIKIFGSAWTPYFCDWAYNAARNDAEAVLYRRPLIKKLWEKIPDDTEILITHGPPYKILDYAPQCGNVGCDHLFSRILDLPKLRANFFGHIHYSHGHKRFNGVDYYNCSICAESYKPINPITVIEYEKNI